LLLLNFFFFLSLSMHLVVSFCIFFWFVCVLFYSICVGGTLGAFSLDILESIN
jgi:hypothetical protein